MNRILAKSAVFDNLIFNKLENLYFIFGTLPSALFVISDANLTLFVYQKCLSKSCLTIR